MNLEALQKATASLASVIQGAKELVGSDTGLKQLLERPGRVFCPAIAIYAKLLEDHGLQRLEELDRLHEGKPEAKAFRNVEEEWDGTVHSIDHRSGAQVTTSDLNPWVPMDVVLAPASDPGETMTLRDVMEQKNSPMLHLVLLRHLS